MLTSTAPHPAAPDSQDRDQVPAGAAHRWRRAAAVLGVLLAVAVVATTGAIADSVMTSAERDSVVPYGHRVPVTGGELNIYEQDGTGPTIVMLSGYATAAPALDFAPLIRALHGFRLVVVEGFGYGYSDTTAPARTIDNITTELHEAVSRLHLGEPYVLLGHSIAGIYDLAYANRYPGEVAAVIGVDASVPGQINGIAGQGSVWNTVFPGTGLLRLVSTIMPTLVDPDSTAYTAEERQQMRTMTNWNWANPAVRDEADQSDANFAAVQNLTYPADLPVLSFIKTTGNPPGWKSMHLAQLQNLTHAELVEVDGGHYLHWTHAEQLASHIREFLATTGVTR